MQLPGDDPGGATPASALMGLVGGFHVARALQLAAKLRIADLLDGKAKSAVDLAAETATHPAALMRLMRLLVCVGVFAQDERGAFALTPLSMRLRSDAPDSLRDFILFHLGREAYEAWAELEHAVTSGNIAFNRAFGMGVWEYRARHGEYAALFDRAMSDLAAEHIDGVVAAYPFASFRTIVDIGGGTGKLLAGILSANPALKGVLFDLPHVAQRARYYLACAGLQARCQVMEGDVFSGVPDGADLYVLSRVIHDWTDSQALAILGNCRRAMSPRGRVLLVERVLPAAADASPALRAALVSDLTMMVMNGGRERTEDEYRNLLSQSGLALTRTTPTKNAISVLEATLAD